MYEADLGRCDHHNRYIAEVIREFPYLISIPEQSFFIPLAQRKSDLICIGVTPMALGFQKREIRIEGDACIVGSREEASAGTYIMQGIQQIRFPRTIWPTDAIELRAEIQFQKWMVSKVFQAEVQDVQSGVRNNTIFVRFLERARHGKIKLQQGHLYTMV